MKIGKSQFCDEYKFKENGFLALNAAIARIGVSAEKAVAAIQTKIYSNNKYNNTKGI